MAGRFHYVYILVSLSHPGRQYTGFTTDLEARLRAHNEGKCPHTSKFITWRIETAIAFASRQKAMTFERYLKTHSGRAFAAKHF
jgi:predicted GIY-YIG superfamily endonuclease